MILAASSVGDILSPLFTAVASILAFFYAVIPNYAVAIALLTITIMLLVSPLTMKSTRSMVAMQRLAPEVKKLQQKYKGDRQRLNEEMMKFYKENNVSPLGGCLPMLLQLPAFFVMYQVIRGLTQTAHVNGHVVGDPKYVSHSTELYHNLHASGGKMMAFGVDLSQSVTSHHSSFAGALPYIALIAAAIGLQYLQMRQLNGRNPQAAAANPQAQMLTRYMPLVFAFIYIGIPAAVNIYFVVSSVCRIGQQELMFRYDPVIRRLGPGIPAKATEVNPGGSSKGGAGGKGAARSIAGGARARPASTEADEASREGDEGANGKAGRAEANGKGQEAGQGAKRPTPNGSRRSQRRGAASASENGGGAKKSHPRSQSKRRRKAR